MAAGTSSLEGLPSRPSLASRKASSQESTTSATSKPLPPLASKLTTVLSTSYSDTEFRDALLTLDERGVKNDAETRRRIRLDLQKEVIDSNGDVVNEFGRVAEQLHRIRATLHKLNTVYDGMKQEVVAAHNGTSSALSEASSLLSQQDQVKTKQALLASLENRFTMSEDEVATLTLTSEAVDSRFFDALSKAKKISNDCQVLLGLENQTLGLELTDQTSKNINLGFQKLYKWIQREFKTLNLENPQMNPSIRRALRVLAERPTLFQNCLNFFAEARERILSDAFYTALTGESASGGSDQSVKPIDMAAHDPLRYAGDMLAWIHSATVSEREALEVLFVAEGEELAKGLKSGRSAEIWRLVDADEDNDADDFNALQALNDLVDRDTSGAARILRRRIEQVIQSNEDIIPAYKLANLINFYRITFQKLLGSESTLLEAMGGLEAEAQRQFRSLIRDHIATLHGEFQQTPADLGPPGFLQDCLKQLDAIMKTYDSSLSTPDQRESEFEGILGEAFEPFMAGCNNMAASIPAPDNTIFLINCRLAAAASLEAFDFTRQRLRQLREQIAQDSKALTENQHEFFRAASGLDDLLNHTADKPQGSSPALDRDSLAQASQRLDDFLPSALMDAMDRLRHLQDLGLARGVTEKAAEKFCDDFERLEEAICGFDEESSEPDESSTLREAFPRTTAEIRVLLS